MQENDPDQLEPLLTNDDDFVGEKDEGTLGCCWGCVVELLSVVVFFNALRRG